MNIQLDKVTGLQAYSQIPAHIWAYAQRGDNMKKIDVFDTEAKRIDEIADTHDTCDASVVEVLFDIIDEYEIDIDLYIMKGA